MITQTSLNNVKVSISIYLAMKTLVKTYKSGTNAIQLLNRNNKPYMQINYKRLQGFSFICLNTNKDISKTILDILKTDY